jgi:hydrogenase nickel incorporation protein HypA/HybF
VHESALARELLGAVLARAEGARVRVVRGWVAETEALSRESLAFHFTAHARGTAAEGARLELDLLRVQARCARCALIYAPEHHVVLCPACGGAEAELLGDVGLGLRALEVEAP